LLALTPMERVRRMQALLNSLIRVRELNDAAQRR